MYKDYYSFKKKQKRERWVYDRATSEWKRESSARYAERYLNVYLFWWILMVALAFTLVLVFLNVPFTHNLSLKLFDSPALMLNWFLLMAGLFVIGFFTKRFIRCFLLSTIIFIVAFMVSDVIMLNYDTPLYVYFGAGAGLGILFTSMVWLIHFVLKRKP